MSVGRFLAGVGALIWEQQQGRYLLLKRAADKDFAADTWECVTGRVDQGEGFEAAVRREVREEIGVEIKLLALIGTTHFYRGPARPEYEMLGVVYLATTPTPELVQYGYEHSDCRWLTAEEALALLSPEHPSEQELAGLLRRAEMTTKLLPAELHQWHQEQGFELN